MKIITHKSPDWDAIGSVYLVLKAFPRLESKYGVGFVNAGEHGSTSDITVDTGGTYDSSVRIFDHHFAGSNHKSAIMAIWENNEFGVRKNFPWLDDLVTRIDLGDQGFSRGSFMHYALHGFKKSLSLSGSYSDHEVLFYGLAFIYDLEITLRERHEAMSHITWRGEHVIFMGTGNAVSTRTALEETGAYFAFFVGEPVTLENGKKTYPRGVVRNAAFTDIPVRDLLPTELSDDELARWYVHPKGFYAGTGSSKASPEYAPADYDMISRIAAYADDIIVRQGALHGR